MTVESQGFEMLEPEGYLQPRRYKMNYRCELCGTEYHRVCKAPPRKDPPCPNKGCGDKARIAEMEKQIANLTRMLESGVPPAQIGHKTITKAIDATASIVMEDYGKTDLRDNLRVGDTMAPKLPAAQQHAADTYFGGGGFAPHQIPSITGQKATHGITAKQMNRLGQKAMAGGFRHMAVPPTIVRPAAQQGESPLIRVGTEKLK